MNEGRHRRVPILWKNVSLPRGDETEILLRALPLPDAVRRQSKGRARGVSARMVQGEDREGGKAFNQARGKMMYAMGYGQCYSCGRPFSFNPVRVPSIRINGSREPICRSCVEVANPKRIKNGLQPIVLHPDAYEACDERELGDD